MLDSPLSPPLAPWPSAHSCACAHPPSRSCQQKLGGQTLVGAGFPACRLLPALLEEEFCFINEEAAAPPGASSTTTPLSPGHDPGGQSPETRTLSQSVPGTFYPTIHRSLQTGDCWKGEARKECVKGPPLH